MGLKHILSLIRNVHCAKKEVLKIEFNYNIYISKSQVMRQ